MKKYYISSIFPKNQKQFDVDEIPSSIVKMIQYSESALQRHSRNCLKQWLSYNHKDNGFCQFNFFLIFANKNIMQLIDRNRNKMDFKQFLLVWSRGSNWHLNLVYMECSNDYVFTVNFVIKWNNQIYFIGYFAKFIIIFYFR